ncbi:DNA-3-methyladenine glycosylase [Kribbella sp. CA-245084]|uniref:DNA-3-methyladenine glycosylase n=1 Tax=Kribbella sp. CA-245084 TaxID=3239940 RepID=UPI003D8E854D
MSETRMVRPASATRLHGEFYLRPAVECATEFLGKVLVRCTAAGRIAGVIHDVESYPAFADDVHHGNKRTPRTTIMWEAGGVAYVYLAYGMWHQFAAVVNRADVPDVVFIRGVVPVEGIDLMAAQWDKPRAVTDLANSPGKLCKSFQITKDLYGADLTADELFLEDWRIPINAADIHTTNRVGISTQHDGHDAPLRYHLTPKRSGWLPT